MRNRSGLYPIVLAVQQGNADIVKRLLQYKAKPTQEDPVTQQNALHVAAKSDRYPEIIEVLTTVPDKDLVQPTTLTSSKMYHEYQLLTKSGDKPED